eukprot:gene19006-23287_t
MSSRRMLILMVLVLSVGLGLELILWRYPELVGTVAGADLHSTWMLATAMATMLLVVLLASQLILGRRVGEFSYRQVLADDVEASSAVALQTTEHRHDLDRLTESLSDRHGRFWKRRVCIYLVVGGTREVEAIAPGLMHAGWLE